MDFRRDSVVDLAARVRSGELAAREVVTHALSQIDRLNPMLNAFVAVDADAALDAAGAIDERVARGDDVGPLAGIPIGVKDLEDAAGYVTTYGSDLHTADPPATADSPLVARLKAAGCVVVGKTNTPEFGFKGVTDNVPFGATTNPWDTRRSPGGSSGGSGAAIAGGLVPLATGSDGGGSIRIPSALCGLSGIKTSQGRVPLGGPKPPGSGVLSVKGPMTRTTRDAAVALDACVGHEPTDPYSLPSPAASWAAALDGDVLPTRVGYSRTMGFATVDPEIGRVVDGAVDALVGAGVEVVDVPTVFDEDPVMAWFVLWTSARRAAQGHLKGTPAWERIDPELRGQIEYAERLTAVDHVRALDAVHLLNLRLLAAFDTAGVDVLLTPTVAGQTPVLGHQGTVDHEEVLTWVSFTPVINVTRNPAGSVCAGVTAAGLPVGIQAIGRPHGDIDVLRTMAALEDVLAIDRVAPIG
ncbi:MAG TPA: amidase family protein [Acidimicrobiales bacterium]|nr:amidase family protein [Acidimicrobiales bacterium]